MAALSMVVMMLTGLIPMGEFALPAIAGMFLIPIVTEIGCGAAWLTYGAVSLLSLIAAPSKECALYYVLFLGCYPLIKSFLERRRSRGVEWALKFWCSTSWRRPLRPWPVGVCLSGVRGPAQGRALGHCPGVGVPQRGVSGV